MHSKFFRTTVLAILPTAGMLVLAGCSGSDTPASGASSTTTSAPASTLAAQQADVTIAVTVANGKVTPSGATIKVNAGQTVLVTAVSDAVDEVHVHGYDKELPLTPGKPASVKFTANMKGTFEIETHESGKLVAKLVVS
jgi:hypothetical protein